MCIAVVNGPTERGDEMETFYNYLDKVLDNVGNGHKLCNGRLQWKCDFQRRGENGDYRPVVCS